MPEMPQKREMRVLRYLKVSVGSSSAWCSPIPRFTKFTGVCIDTYFWMRFMELFAYLSSLVITSITFPFIDEKKLESTVSHVLPSICLEDPDEGAMTWRKAVCFVFGVFSLVVFLSRSFGNMFAMAAILRGNIILAWFYVLSSAMFLCWAILFNMIFLIDFPEAPLKVVLASLFLLSGAAVLCHDLLRFKAVMRKVRVMIKQIREGSVNPPATVCALVMKMASERQEEAKQREAAEAATHIYLHDLNPRQDDTSHRLARL